MCISVLETQLSQICVSNEFTVVTCPVLSNPPNGVVQHSSGVEYLSTAQYTCNTGFTRSSGDMERMCQSDGTWSGSEPVCIRESNNCSLKSHLY